MHVAVFVDFENLFLSLKNRNELSGHRIRDLCLSILENLKSRLQSESSPMVMGRSYAAFDTYPGSEFAHDLALMGFDPQYVLVGHSGKNSADVQLAVDVCRVLFRRPDIQGVVIVSGDRDFIPIARQVLEENRELRVVAIPDATSGDLRMRVGSERFWNAMDLLPVEPRPLRTAIEPAQRPGAEHAATSGPAPNGPASNGPAADQKTTGTAPTVGPSALVDAGDCGEANGGSPMGHPVKSIAVGERAARAAIVGHIPVTWRTPTDESDTVLLERLATCLDLIVRAQIRHGSREIWLSPFLKGPMSQHFSGMVHPERRALINELRNRGVIRVEERENQFADHPYSVIVLDEAHPLAQAAIERMRRV